MKLERLQKIGVLIIAIIALLCSLYAIFFLREQGEWECVQTACTAFLNEEEIASQVCSQTEQGELCSLNVDGQIAVVPREQLNFTSLQFCKEEVCVKEIKTRSLI